MADRKPSAAATRIAQDLFHVGHDERALALALDAFAEAEREACAALVEELAYRLDSDVTAARIRARGTQGGEGAGPQANKPQANQTQPRTKEQSDE
jgi:hypothetical protein